MAGTMTLSEAFEQICLMDGPLNVRLAAYADKLRELNFPFAEAYDNLVARLMAGEVGSAAPKVGDFMPPFVLPSHTGQLVGLEELTAKGPVVISLNRGHWCPFCKIELRTIAAYHREISALGAEVVSILPDRQKFIRPLAADTAGSLSILTDIDNGYALSLGLVMWLGDKIKELMKGRGIDLEAIQGNEGWYVPLPATFVVSKHGLVTARHVDPEFRTRMDIDEILTALASSRK